MNIRSALRGTDTRLLRRPCHGPGALSRRWLSTCPYGELGLKPGASEAQVKEAYRASAKKWHPDAYRGTDHSVAEAKFRRATEAYSSLIDHAGGASRNGGAGGVSGDASGVHSRDEYGQTSWRRQYARPKSRAGQDAANYWRARAEATRPGSYGQESEFYEPPEGSASTGRLVLGPLAFAIGLGVCTYYASSTPQAGQPDARTPSSASASGDAPRMVDAVYNTKRRRWETPHPSFYNDPLVAGMIRQQPAANVYRPPNR